MNTKKFFMLLAAVLLGSVSAFAQSGNNEPLKGDVNGDGTVDVADIAAVIAIIKNNAAPQTTYYWYVGTDPITTSSVPGSGTVSAMDASTTLGWHNITGTPTEIIVGPVPEDENWPNWYIAIPSSLQITKATSGGLTDQGVTSSLKTLSDGVEYRIFVIPNTDTFKYIMTK